MEEAIVRDTFIYSVSVQQRQNTLKAVAGDEQFGGHNLIAQLEGLTQQSAVIIDC